MDKQRSSGLSKSCILIIVVAGVERFAYKGIASNLVTYLTDVVKMSTSSAAKSVSTWNGVTSMLPLITAILADSYWDRYSTIMASSLLYIIGLLGLTSWALLEARMPCSSLFFPLYLISVGQGGYNPSLQAFGADQLELDDNSSDEKKSKIKSQFFQWWYFGICTGSLLGNSVVPYVQDSFGWGLGFAIPCAFMAFSVVSFLSGTNFYVRKQGKLGNDKKRTFESIAGFVKDVMASLIARKGKIKLPSLDQDEESAIKLELQEKPHKNDPNSFKGESNPFVKLEESPPPSVIKIIARLFPIWTMLLMFAVIFQQPATFFTKQGMLMNHMIGKSFVIPPAMLQSVLTITIILLMPLYDKLLIPLLRLLTHDEKGISVLQRIGLGMLLSIIAMIIASGIESNRIHESKKGRDLSIFWLLPQYILLGVSDVFTVVGIQEFFYTEVHKTMRTIGIALYFSVFGVGSVLGAFLISVLEIITARKDDNNQGWFSDDPREARLDKYYLFLAILSSISFFMFTYFSRYYNNSSRK
ncbi:hypothetical protein LUZ60_000285 [Juncus effusus]|nr:hypothetical protein LUZ60_000285 [Juncus effusus]